MIYHIGMVYAENDTKLSKPIRLGANYDENQIGQDVTNRIDALYVENEI